MRSTKLLLTTVHHIHRIPINVQKSLRWDQTSNLQSNLSFVPEAPSVLATKVLKSYFDKGLIKDARVLFDEMPDRDVVAWTTVIAGYVSCNHHISAWNVFYEMMKSEIQPNAFTISSVLKACKGMNDVLSGVLVHGLAVKYGVDGSIYVDNALMDMYATCCITMHDACVVFQHICAKNAVSWTTLIAGFTHRGDGHGGLCVFRHMLQEEAEVSPFSFSIAVRASASIGSHILGKSIHAAVTKHGFESNLPVMNSILDMYSRCGYLSDARQYFHEMSQKDLVTWNTLIAGYEGSDASESLYIFSLMESEGFSPNCFTFTSVIAACANLEALNCGQQVHGGSVRRGLDMILELANALVDMYAKCGNIIDSRKVFSEMTNKNLVSWTSMMIGYGAHGYGKEAVQLFDQMVMSGIRPDRIVFMAVLSACSHAGLVDEGLRYFKLMRDDYKVSADQEIYGCAVDLLGRSGRINEAYKLIQSMPFKPDDSVWGALLGACKAHRLPKLGKLAARRVLDLRPNGAGTYVILSNLYAAEGKWGKFAKMRKFMKRMAIKKEAGRSWIEVRNWIYSFVVGDKMGSHNRWVYGVLYLLIQHMKEAGYVPDFDCFTDDLEDGT